MMTMCSELRNINKAILCTWDLGGGVGEHEKKNKEGHSLHTDKALWEFNMYIHIKVKKLYLLTSSLFKRNYSKE